MITDWIERNNYDNILKEIHQQDIDVLNAMYPDISDSEMENKYKLFLDFELYFPYKFDSINAYIKVSCKDKKVILPTYKVRRPFYNKGYNITSMRNKRKISQRGIPLIFNSFDELKEIKNISCIWTVEKQGRLIYTLTVDYVTNFIKENGKTFYGIHNRDFTLKDVMRFELEERYLNEYNTLIGKNGSEDYFNVISENEDNYLHSFLQATCEVNALSDKNHIEMNDDTCIEFYFADIELQPFTETRMLPDVYAYRN